MSGHLNSSIRFLRFIRCLILGGLIMIFYLSGSTYADGSLVINELMASNNSTIEDLQDQYDDWIEIYNTGTNAVYIGGMYLTDDLSAATKWQIPAGMYLASGRYLIIWADNDIDDYGMHANFKLDADGEQIYLFDSDGITLLDSVTFAEQTTDMSYGRYPDGGTEWRFFASPSPGQENQGGYLGIVEDTKFSRDRGFYDTSFSVAITTETPGATIRYTTDGSTPTETHAQVYTGPILISTTTCLRAMAYKSGWIPTNVDTHTYIFLDDVIEQPQYPPGVPVSGWGHNGPDYEMDPVVVGTCSDTIRDDMMSIPTVSLVMDTDDWFGSKGIYINESQDGTERVVSMEYIDPNSGDDFQLNCAISMQGGVSGGGTSLNRWKSDKLSMRPRFKTTTDDGTPTGGPAKLNFKFFEDSPVDSFDTLVFDARLGNVWNYGGTVTDHGSRPWISGRSIYQPDVAQYTRDQFVADIQNALGGHGQHGRHVHLYINGLYWGLYNLHERPDHRFAASYFGGDPEDYDCVKHNSDMIINGSNATFNQMLSIADSGLASDQQYQLIQKYLDVNDFIDYLIPNYFVGNYDWGHKNWYATHNAADPSGLWHFHHWDGEHLMEALDENVTGRDNAGGPSHLQQQLAKNAEYRLLFADHVHRHFFNDGALTPEGAEALYQVRLDDVDRAVVGESARWGDNQIDRFAHIRYMRNPHWILERAWLLGTYFPKRTEIVLKQFKNRSWYPNVDAPVFYIDGSYQHGGSVTKNSSFSITAPTGSILYTLDGTDPRLPGGSVNASHAQNYSLPFRLNKSVHIKARVLSGNTWSALNEAIYAVGPVAENLRITEIMYHPQNYGEPNDPNEEFIELTNIGSESINLNLVKFTNGIDFTFPGIELSPGEYTVVVQDRDAFEARYGSGINIAGQYSGKLDNAGERIWLEDAIGQTILDFGYKDGWYDSTDGEGFSLIIINPANSDTDSWNEKESWQAGTITGGSPGSQ